MIVMHNERGIHVNIWEWSCHSCVIYVLPTINMSMLTYTMLHNKIPNGNKEIKLNTCRPLNEIFKTFEKYACTVLNTGHSFYP